MPNAENPTLMPQHPEEAQADAEPIIPDVQLEQMRREIPLDKVMTALRLGLRAACHACEHVDYEYGAKRGCGACRAVVAIKEVLAELKASRPR